MRKRGDRPAGVQGHPRLLVVGHAATRSGSPKVLLGVLRWLAANTDFEITLAFGEGGPLVDEARRYVSTIKILSELRAGYALRIATFLAMRLRAKAVETRLRKRIADIAKMPTAPYELVYVNSVPSLRYLTHDAGVSPPLVLHVHELAYILASSLPGDNEALIHLADQYIAVSNPVRQMLVDEYDISPATVEVITGFLPDDEAEGAVRTRSAARAELGLDPEVPVVLGCGAVDWRKGIDIFIATAAKVTRQPSPRPIHWCWVGYGDDLLRHAAQLEIAKAGLDGVVTLVPEHADPAIFYEAADMLLLSSREDPYPLVVLEAALRERPVICQAGSGGAVGFVSRGAGIVVRYLDIDALAEAVLRILASPSLAAEMGRRGRQLVLSEHLASQACPAVGALLLRAAQSGGAKD